MEHLKRETALSLRPGKNRASLAPPCDEGGDVFLAHFENLLLQLLGGPDAELVRRHVAALAVPVGLGDVDDARDGEITLLMQRLHAAQADAGDGGAVVAVPAADHHFLLRLALGRPIVADHTQHGVVGLGAGAGEEHVVHAFRSDVGDRLGQFDHRRVGGLEEQVVERQLAHLPGGGLDQLLAAVADVDAPEAGHRIEDLVALAVPDIDAFGLGDDPRALLVQLLVVGERRQMVVAAQRLPLTGLGVGDLAVHVTPLLFKTVRERRTTPAAPGQDQTESRRNSRSQELITRLKFSCSARFTAT